MNDVTANGAARSRFRGVFAIPPTPFDDAGNVEAMSRAAQAAESTIGVLIEVDIGMHRCGVDPGEPALALARRTADSPGLRFVGLKLGAIVCRWRAWVVSRSQPAA